MLVLTRKTGEAIVIDDNIKITIVQIKGKQVRVGVEAPKETKIHREEIYQAIQEENKAAIHSMANTLPRIGKLKKEDDVKKTGT